MKRDPRAVIMKLVMHSLNVGCGELELGEYLVFACYGCAHLLFGLMSARGEDG